MSEHTPGPWVYTPPEREDEYCCYLGRFEGPGGERVCSFGHSEHYYPSEGSPPNAANARLIAAAPDLLEMLKVAQLWLDADGRYDMQGINAAIAKAEGKS